ncbi:MAG: hypothetical protein A2Y56_05550 [Candidatus Aminicenantes bacterium RBG_13_63_10]|nr:MAG: hypothetical protein A2Y56_05550 [Candidatus Aminicenantes bacterium RBG_13_63_10]
MNGSRGIRINLASEPLKNTRFFRALLAVLLFLLAGALLLDAGLFIRQQTRAGRMGKQAISLRESAEGARLEAKRLESRAKELAGRDRAEVEFVNDIILGKSFSWVGFLQRLEESLPSSSAIVSLAPASAGSDGAEVTMTAVFRNLNDLLSFIRNLNARGFVRVRLVSERNDGFGRIEAQIAVVYAGTF